jgi:hypothetical protein
LSINKWRVIFNNHLIEEPQSVRTMPIDAPQRRNKGLTDRPRCVD